MRIQEASPSTGSAESAASTAGAVSPAPLRLLPAPAPEPLPEPDESARAVLEAAASGDNIVVLGAPGTGKTSLALRMLAGAVGQGSDAVLLAPTRIRADRLRQRAAALLGAEGGGVVRVRTPAALALTILTTSLTQRPDPLPAPVLLAGAEEDAALAALIHPEQWPGLPPEAVASRAFRTELRNLLARAGELGITADELADLGRALDVPLWGPASALLRTWDAQGRPTAERRADTRRMDTARLQDRAAEALATWNADGVAVPPPVPGLVIVDDYQDCTAATARLLAALTRPDERGHRAQVVVLGDPDVAVETFRGGSPSLLSAAEDRSGLAARRMSLGILHRGTPALAALWADQAGRLPVTWPRTVGQVPMIHSHYRTFQPEGAGERYWDEASTPLYPFGHGGSYTTFTYSEPRLSSPRIAVGESVTVSVDVANTGARDGEEVVQLYIHQRHGSSTRPERELKDFARVAIPAGQSRTVEFRLGPDELSYWSAATRSRVQDATTIDVHVGGSSETFAAGAHAAFDVV